ncbi:hypothetical protein KO500_07520 [Cellulophaga baltica]|uniref:hypothetical protein n=1 Tax=Cellulophaga TaxID=104264 RepID=UPI001C077C5F|nr:MULTISPECIES: hypothetical protein [Cellulophaga]MBU2996278.1 hypothetical protein [Cellulophaga baltica]MDO6767673.1 hypothetical protein [Cellulophaga sp. 1_MG-2023]
MIKNFVFGLFIVSCFLSCKEKHNTELSGVYVVGGLKMKENVDLGILKQMGALNFGEAPFNFVGKDSVILDKEFGDTYFGESKFKYKLSDKNLTLINGERKIQMTYEDDGVFRLNIANPYLIRLDLVGVNHQ